MKGFRRDNWLIAGLVLAIVCLILLPAALKAIAKGAEPAGQEDFTAPKAAQAKKFSIHLPCRVVEVVDGDTLTCRVTLDVRVRLLDCWAPELRGETQAEKDKAVASKKHLVAIAENKAGGLFVLLDGTKRLDDVLSFGRVLGRVWVHGAGDLSSKQVATGHAFRRKLELEQALTEDDQE